MRLSLQKAAHANMGGAAYRKSGSPVFFVPRTLGRTWGTRSRLLIGLFPNQLGHIKPPAPADLMVFCQSETEEDAPVARPSQVAKVFGDV